MASGAGLPWEARPRPGYPPTSPFKLNQDRRHRIPRQGRKVANRRDYDANLRRRGGLTVRFTAEAIAAWAAEPRTTRGGQPWHSPLAILTALTWRAVFRSAPRQTEGLIGSIIGLLGPASRVPDHSTLSRRAAALQVPPLPRPGGGGAGVGGGSDAAPIHPLVDGTPLKLYGAGEWPIKKDGTHARRSWRKLHIGLDAETGQIVAGAPTARDVDDAARVGPLLDRVTGAVASFIADGAYDQERAYAGFGERHPEAAVVVPPRATAVLSDTATTDPTRRDRRPRCVAEYGRMGRQERPGYDTRARAEAAIARWKQAIGDGLRSRTDERRATEMDVAAHALNRMLGFGRPIYARIARPQTGLGLPRPHPGSM